MFELKCEYEAEDVILKMIFTPKYLIMHDSNNTLNWVTCYELSVFSEVMSLEKQYHVEGALLKHVFYNHTFTRLIMNQESGILSTVDIVAEKFSEEGDEGDEGQ